MDVNARWGNHSASNDVTGVVRGAVCRLGRTSDACGEVGGDAADVAGYGRCGQFGTMSEKLRVANDLRCVGSFESRRNIIPVYVFWS